MFRPSHPQILVLSVLINRIILCIITLKLSGNYSVMTKTNAHKSIACKNLYFSLSLENIEEQNHSVELLSANELCKK